MTATQPFGLLLGAVLLVSVLLLLPPSARTGDCPVAEEECTRDSCKLPKCNCATNSTPHGLDPQTIPQIVVFAFLGPLDKDSWSPLRKLFANEGKDSKKFINPNGEEITMTLFVTGNGTDDYCRAGEFYRDGHEIGVTSIKGSTETMVSLKPKDWYSQMIDQKNDLVKKAKINVKDIHGMRAPNLEVGGDEQFAAMDFLAEKLLWKLYDSSVVLGEKNAGKETKPLWPYTMNFRFFDIVRPQNRHPVQCYPGVWEIPVQRFYDNYSTAHDFIDEWVAAENEEMLYYTIARNFWRHYSYNHAPFIINAHTDWFKRDPYAYKAIRRFIEVLLDHDLKDIYIVSMDQMLEWVKSPQPLSKIKDSNLFKRTEKRKGAKCSRATLYGTLNGSSMLLIEGAVLLLLLVVLIAKDRAET